MTKEFTVILAKANWCGHCQHFVPIYEESLKNHINDKYLNQFKINFKDYDMANSDDKNNFTINHFNATEMITGYPTVLVNVYDKEKKENKYYTISHTVIDENLKKKDQLQDASSKFLVNIANLIKSIESDGKSTFVQTGGSIDMSNYKTSLQEEIYRKKYLKYKSKYTLKHKELKLKN